MNSTLRLILLVGALVMFLLLGLLGGGIIGDKPADPETIWALLGFGSAAFAAAHL